MKQRADITAGLSRGSAPFFIQIHRREILALRGLSLLARGLFHELRCFARFTGGTVETTYARLLSLLAPDAPERGRRPAAITVQMLRTAVEELCGAGLVIVPSRTYNERAKRLVFEVQELREQTAPARQSNRPSNRRNRPETRAVAGSDQTIEQTLQQGSSDELTLSKSLSLLSTGEAPPAPPETEAPIELGTGRKRAKELADAMRAGGEKRAPKGARTTPADAGTPPAAARPVPAQAGPSLPTQQQTDEAGSARVGESIASTPAPRAADLLKTALERGIALRPDGKAAAPSGQERTETGQGDAIAPDQHPRHRPGPENRATAV